MLHARRVVTSSLVKTSAPDRPPIRTAQAELTDQRIHVRVRVPRQMPENVMIQLIGEPVAWFRV